MIRKIASRIELIQEIRKREMCHYLLNASNSQAVYCTSRHEENTPFPQPEIEIDNFIEKI